MADANSKKFGAEDRLSNLPEAIITHILSFLPAENAVRTSVLSTKWIYRWTAVTNLHFYDGWIYSRIGKNKKERFINFVERVLLFGNPTVQNFYLSCSSICDASRVRVWISVVIRRNVRKIDINFPFGSSLVLPSCLYSSDSLVELNLLMPCTFNVPAFICFSSLKILQLSGVMFFNMYFSRSSELHFSFPLLEVLCLNGCKWQKVKVVKMDAPKLNSFKITDDRMIVNIRGPIPKEFEGCGYPFVEFILPHLSSNVDATIKLNFFNLDQNPKMALLTCALLRQLSSLKYLTLSLQTIVALSYVEDLQDHLPMFSNLIHLTITSGTPLLDGTLIALLQSLPVLESLIFKEDWFTNGEMVQEEVPTCFQPNLKLVKFEDFHGRNFELVLAKFLLKNAMILEEMTITAGSSLRRHSESEIEAVKEQLLAFPRGSDRASIFFKSWCCYSYWY